MMMIEKVSKKIFVKNVEHTKLSPNKQFSSSNLELGLRFHLQILPATTGV
jgi:hypothetical protein